MTDRDLVYSKWSSHIFPCSKEGCGFVGELDAYEDGGCYSPCPRCGAPRNKKATGRFIYRIVRHRWFAFLNKKRLVGVEWRFEVNNVG